MNRVLVVGGGIVGLSTAYWLVKSGVGVTLVEQGPIPNPLASSADHHRLIRFAYGDRSGYAARMPEAFAAWRAVWADLPRPEGHYYVETGVLSVSTEQGDGPDRSRDSFDALGVEYEQVEGASLAKRLPFLEPDGVRFALLTQGGALMANRILVDLADWLRRNGASVLEHAAVVSVDAEGGRVALADGRTIGADEVVVAAGVATARLMPELELPLSPRRSVIVYADPPADLIEAYAAAPSWSQLGADSDLWGLASVEGLPMKLGNGGLRRPGDPADRFMGEAEARAVLDGYRGRFRGIDGFHIRWHQANWWTMAPEERFLLRRQGRAVAVSACSGHGFKFGALSGRDVAQAVTGEQLDAVAERMAG